MNEFSIPVATARGRSFASGRWLHTRGSATRIEVLDGLKEGDRVILSDMSDVDNANRPRLTDEKHLLKH